MEKKDRSRLTTFELENILNDANIPGLVAIVVNRTDILYEQAVGYHFPGISKERQPMDSSKSIFVLASISKTFIVIAVMQLVEQNLLDLDQDINKYLSTVMKVHHPLHPNSSITLRHLLSHTSSIASNFQDELQHYQPNDDFLSKNLVETISKYLENRSHWLDESPGNVTHYSNIGPSLAALIVECVSNISFEQYVQENILNRLGIHSNEASYRISNFEHRKQDLVEHYLYDSSWLEKLKNFVPQLNITQSNSSNWLYVPQYGANDYPSGSLRMSAHSLSKFLQSFLNNCSSLLLESSVDEMLRIVRHENADVEYGLIWNWRNIGGRCLVGHRGAVPGVTHVMMANEQRTLGVLILSNGDISTTDEHAKKVYETLIDLMLQLFDFFE